ncbi:MAG: rubrerythrin family protein [Candidatus Lokiarchaeota archaeon]|nr:rubrerythrin family protein [Candidatus Lokiarchaeota archaeon]MBD3198553.1 rubrerythrin family protein [Candidatus Lokiarchaeota archaeon]
MTKTKQNLKDAFAGESQANRKYLAFAQKAEQDGYPQIAKVFRAAASAETVHAHNHLRAMGGIKSTMENVKAAIEGEHYEFSKMYPEFLEDAKEEKHKDAIRTFNYANEVEKVHHELYNKALNAVKEENDLEEQDMHVCSVCGYTVEGDAPDKCPVCGAAKKAFNKIE